MKNRTESPVKVSRSRCAGEGILKQHEGFILGQYLRGLGYHVATHNQAVHQGSMNELAVPVVP